MLYDKRTSLTPVLMLGLLISLASPSVQARGRKGPSGTFKSGSRTVTLAYVGEGNVKLSLKTKYCALSAKPGGKVQAMTFVPRQGIVVRDTKGKPLLVIFYQRKQIVVWGGLERFKKRFCRGGLDATGVYKRR